MKAIVYVRVSSQDQVKNFSLETQETVCRDYCERHGWEIGQVAREKGESAKTVHRSELQKVLARVQRPGHGFGAFVVYDLTRFSRDTMDYLTLKKILAQTGIALVSVTQPIDESPTGEFMGVVMAAHGQLDNRLRSERVRAGMKAAAEHGVWTFQALPGYRSVRTPEGRATLRHDPAVAPLIRSTFEKIATGTVTQEEARAALAKSGVSIPRQTFSRLVHSSLYYGRIVVRPWGIDAPGNWKPIVSEEVWRRAQAALAGSPRGWVRSDLRPEFPLRWWTRCGAPGCGRGLTGYFGTGKLGKKYGYYRCPGKTRHQNVKREEMHAAFRALLATKTCSDEVWRIFELTLQDRLKILEERAAGQRTILERRSRAVAEREEKLVEALLDGRLGKDLFDRQKAKLDAERAEILAATALPRVEFKPALEAGRLLAQSPLKAWDTLTPEARPRFLRAAFPGYLTFSPESGFQTPTTSLYLADWTTVARSTNQIGEPAGADVAPWLSLVSGWMTLVPILEDQCRAAYQ